MVLVYVWIFIALTLQIDGDVITRTTANRIHHSDIFEGLSGVHCWTGHTFVLVF
ncbi:hypothetical protein MTR_4g032100 [Medicago truncatula]|uniref:Transmembrane protein n=1 Tax=Medicago truncatula TaxID=3880 RepID=G7JN42_MEDTR|nr:hypothetical protein MTR_4g032100 [Medicago truncatula]